MPMTTTTTTNSTKPSVKFTANNGAVVTAVLMTNERFNRSYAVNVNGTTVAVLRNVGRGRYTWPAFAAASRQSFLGDLKEAVRSVASGATDYHVEGCTAYFRNQPEGNIDWDAKCNCGLFDAALQAAKEYNNVAKIKARTADTEAAKQARIEARRALFPKVRAALVEALGVEDDDDPTTDDEGLVWLYASGVTLNHLAVDNYRGGSTIEITLDGLAKILGVTAD